MKQQFFSSLFGSGARPTNPASSSNPVVITSSSQPHVLQRKMKESNMTHGETVTANISPVRVEAFGDKAVMYFCPMREIRLVASECEGDGGAIPGRAIVEGLNIPAGFKSGLYTLKNVKLSSNGTMQVFATNETEWEWYSSSDHLFPENALAI